ncbi:MAG TPA: nuclear transport factor 2 family protein [Nevskiaceae bacterium]
MSDAQQGRRCAESPQDLARLVVARANAGDLDGLLAPYEPDAVLATGAETLARGATAIRAFFDAARMAGVRFDAGDQRPAIVSDDLARTSTRLPDGSITAEVARRGADGGWRWVINQSAIAK